MVDTHWGPYNIALIGSAGSGKDTMADILLDYLPSSKKYAFADEVKRLTKKMLEDIILSESLSINLDQMDSAEFRVLMRPFWQWFGTEFGRERLGKHVWVDALARRIEKESRETVFSIIVTDCRFQNEYEWLKNNNYVIVRVHGEWRKAFGIPNHSSETEHVVLQEDIIYNNCSPKEDMISWVQNDLIPFCEKKRKMELIFASQEE